MLIGCVAKNFGFFLDGHIELIMFALCPLLFQPIRQVAQPLKQTLITHTQGLFIGDNISEFC